MAKNSFENQDPANSGGPSFHPAVTSLGRMKNDHERTQDDKPRTFNSFKSLAEILGARNDDEALVPDDQAR